MQKGKEFEQEAYKFLKDKFDVVEWLSEKKKSSYDFKCEKDGIIYYGDAKEVNSNNKPRLMSNQRDADFVIAKIKGNLIFIEKKDINSRVTFETSNQDSIKLDEDVIMQINICKYKWQMKTQSEVIRRILEILTKFETADKIK